MSQQKDFLNDIIAREVLDYGPVEKILTPISITSTSVIAKHNSIKRNIDKKVFYPSIYFRIFYILIIIGLLLVSVIGAFNKNSNLSGLLFFYAFVIVMIVIGIQQLFLNTKMNYKITVDRKGIAIANEFYNWNDIYETAIMRKGSGSKGTPYLVIALSDMTTYEKFELTNFYVEYTLSKYIEYFRFLSGNNKSY